MYDCSYVRFGSAGGWGQQWLETGADAHGYQRAWKALKCIGTPEDLVIYQKLEQKDLVVVKDITSAKRFGQGSDSYA